MPGMPHFELSRPLVGAEFAHCRTRTSQIARVAQERSDAAASTVSSSTDRAAGAYVVGAETSSSQIAAGAAAVVAGSGLAGFGGAQHLNGHAFGGPLPGLPVTAQHDNSAGGNQGDANGHPSSSSSSSAAEDTSYIDGSSYAGRQWAGAAGSSGQPGEPMQQNWEPPRYRRSGLRLRSKRELQAAEKLQQSGGNLIADLQTVLSPSTSSGAAESAAEENDQHLEAFIEQMLCPKTSTWKRSAATASTADGREAIDPELLASIHTAPLEQVQQQQQGLVARKQLLAALLLLEEATAAGRMDVLRYTQHKPFLRAAGGSWCWAISCCSSSFQMSDCCSMGMSLRFVLHA